MAVIKLKPTTPGQRFMVRVVNHSLHKGKPVKGLTKFKKKSGGRNNAGRLTVEGIGGGARRRYRLVDYKRNKTVPAKVERLEYDPNRTAYLAVLLYADGERRYSIATKNMKVGDSISSGPSAPIKEGNCLPLSNMPIGTVICCVELKPGKGAQLVRSAGGFAQLLARDGNYATLRLRSGEMRKVLADCRAIVGEIGNSEHNLKVYGKAGVKRHLGVRPNVRGVAKNPIDHPLGGGEGKTSGGRPSCNKNGLECGKKTRKKSKDKGRTKLIVRRRGVKKKKG